MKLHCQDCRKSCEHSSFPKILIHNKINLRFLVLTYLSYKGDYKHTVSPPLYSFDSTSGMKS